MVAPSTLLVAIARLVVASVSLAEPPPMAKGDRPVPVDVKCDDLQEPTLVQRVEPNYPAHIRRQGWEGEVELKIIGTDGKVSDLSVLKNPGKPLSDLAVAAVSQWVYKPAYCKGLQKPVRVSIVFTTTFRLNRK
jgi:TonB family protein